MGILFQFLFITFLLLKVDSFNCPRGSDEVPREDVCVIGINEPKFYFDASRDCVSRGGVTAKIQNLYENSFIFTLIDQDVNGAAPYIGIERKPNNTWVYGDGSPLVYLNWALEDLALWS
ncbi:unnamed protein product, partial [Mesorhabditis belari]|uniref:C-type lectin domain-containing protein n=1 Tax=Mesorhabditis belari TaxID=2138241 RepID=A0AAF3EL27_9BILA